MSHALTPSSEKPLAIPKYAYAVLHALEEQGYESWIVGGFVRDALLGRPSTDIDIASNASWQEVQRISEAHGWHTHETGIKHGTITVVIDSNALEITTYRIDGAYKDARHPSQIETARTIEEDLARRDFTINAMAYHPDRGICDPYQGQADLAARIIRTVGDPQKRFAEDALRMLRACRFEAQLGFSIDECTYRGMYTNKQLLSHVSTERLVHELSGLLMGEYAGRALMDTVDVLSVVLPELVAMKGFEQKTPYHIYDVLEHTAHVIDGVPAYPLVRWAALFHDMGKPASFFTDEAGVGHFYGHADVSVMMARCIMKRLSLASGLSERVLALVKRHDDVIEASPKAVKRALSRLNGDVELFAALCDLKRGDARGQAPHCIGRVELANELERVLADIIAADEAFSLKKLAINGHDVMSLGITAGPDVGRALEAALEAVIDERVPNEATELRAFVKTWATTGCNKISTSS